MSSGTNLCRGILRMASKIVGSSMPRGAICSSTICDRNSTNFSFSSGTGLEVGVGSRFGGIGVKVTSMAGILEVEVEV